MIAPDSTLASSMFSPDSVVVASAMGSGRLRAARSLAQMLGCQLWRADGAPLCNGRERRLWELLRKAHDLAAQDLRLPLVGPGIRRLLDGLTMIPPLRRRREFAGPSLASRLLDALIESGFGGALVGALRTVAGPLLTTFYAPAVIADRAGHEPVYCVVTDADVNRVWVPIDPRESNIKYFAPTRGVVRRLRAFGVSDDRIAFTGFPLPKSLVGDEHLDVLRRNLGPRLARLDPRQRFRQAWRHEVDHFLADTGREQEREPPLLTIAVGGEGTQAGLVDAFLPGIRQAVVSGRIRLALVAGTSDELAGRFRRALDKICLDRFVGRGVEILHAPSLDTVFDQFDALLARTDILWTRPNELTFYAALGIPLLLTEPAGPHERFNARFAAQHGLSLPVRSPRTVADRITQWLYDGTLAANAWSGFMRLPKFGTQRILEEVRTRPTLTLTH